MKAITVEQRNPRQPVTKIFPELIRVTARSSWRRSPSGCVDRRRDRRGNMAGRAEEPRGFVLGHESLGRVIDPGFSSSFKKGDLVWHRTAVPIRFSCPACAVGEWDMCRNGQYTERGIKNIPRLHVRTLAYRTEYAIKLDPAWACLAVLLEPTTVHRPKALNKLCLHRPTIFLGTAHHAGDGCGSDRAFWRRSPPRCSGSTSMSLTAWNPAPKADLVRALGATYHSVP